MTATFGKYSSDFPVPFPSSTKMLYSSGCLGRSYFKIAMETQRVDLARRSNASAIRLEAVGRCSCWNSHTSSDKVVLSR